MDRGRSQNHTDRKPTVIDIGMKLKTDPGFKVALSVFLGPHDATYGNLFQGLLDLLGHLTDQTTLRLGLADFSPARRNGVRFRYFFILLLGPPTKLFSNQLYDKVPRKVNSWFPRQNGRLPRKERYGTGHLLYSKASNFRGKGDDSPPASQGKLTF